ncbi:hypothetical protein [Legionella maioricensis]|uniref:Uncharacterized protein n=1 Tax=Legionella maioricensis TaxID=2896528 RepID=A0A9X2D1I9_9GAMM|nr:hypothetical protein [Legionella maioricensis]MCL9684706.1 hypothetical protein [Legionella maioricensis]MCL9687734.1 hypothetical protein [Legionella maioricensis]
MLSLGEAQQQIRIVALSWRVVDDSFAVGLRDASEPTYIFSALPGLLT